MKTGTLEKNNSATNKQPSVGVSPIEVLSNRELEVFRLIGEGKTTSNIAKQFDRSIKTIETYRSRIKNKLSLKHNMELIRSAMHWFHHEDPQNTQAK